ncbi:MOSC domain-containing protein [Gephyromycinifex aptenodytis]|uniref:hypothetical protein n=1 Tax=Gephyromycinifex aptenodytis TaxID=2716227 RepID=UPI00144794D5|nr:hypothetical protein [Gephyromycinifex aptenodytis]
MTLLEQDVAGRVLTLAIYPEKQAPGRLLTEARIETEGLQGDRRKKRPVHLVGREEDPESTRANIFLDMPDAELQRAVGRRVRLGTAMLEITEVPSACPGVYASVVRVGVVNTGDALEPGA